MKILGLDTSTSVNTVAICDNDTVLVELVVECGRAHSERLMSTIDWALREAGMAVTNLDALAVSVGPGSFTGLRIGVAAAKGLALAAHLPLVAVPTLDAMARIGAFEDRVVCPLLDAKMREVFGAAFAFTAGDRKTLLAPCVAPVQELLHHLPPDTVFFGDGADLYRDIIKAELPAARILGGPFRAPRASSVCAEATWRVAQGCSTDPGAVAPVYLRMSQPEMMRTRAKP